jgi:hypothetical protein
VPLASNPPYGQAIFDGGPETGCTTHTIMFAPANLSTPAVVIPVRQKVLTACQSLFTSREKYDDQPFGRCTTSGSTFPEMSIPSVPLK